MVGGAVFFKRTHAKYNIVAHLLVPAAGVILFAAALYGSIYPTPPSPLNATPYITVAWIIVGLIVVVLIISILLNVVLWMRYRNKNVRCRHTNRNRHYPPNSHPCPCRFRQARRPRRPS